MTHYLIRRLILLPITLFAIILVNFIILNLAPGDPVNQIQRDATKEGGRSGEDKGLGGENAYLQFREHYGLTLPILFNVWPKIRQNQVSNAIKQLTLRKKNPQDEQEMPIHAYNKLRIAWGDKAKFIMPLLLAEAENKENSLPMRQLAANLFIRGGTLQGHVGPALKPHQREENRIISESNQQLFALRALTTDSEEETEKKILGLKKWYETRKMPAHNSWRIFLTETRFFRYFSRVLTLDFGTLRNDSNRTVISEVAKRMKYSLTLAIIPMLVTFILCQIFGMIMATQHNRWPDFVLNIFFLILFAIPIFVVAPFLIEKIALHRKVFFTDIPIPFSGFHSPDEIYATYVTPRKLADISLHIFLPLVAIIYGTLAVQSRLSRTAFLEVMKQDYIRTARAKGLPYLSILVKHVGRNGAITILTSLAASLGVILGGSLIVETVFEINGFGRFFYEAIINRDYNVVLFSAISGSVLSLVGYLIADFAYTFLDPRVTLDS